MTDHLDELQRKSFVAGWLAQLESRTSLSPAVAEEEMRRAGMAFAQYRELIRQRAEAELLHKPHSQEEANST